MIDYIDLHAFLSARKSLRGVGIYCHVDTQINRPSALKSDVVLQQGGKFVSATIFAVDLKNYKQSLLMSGVIGESDRYLVNASTSIYVDENLTINDWYYFEGTLALSSSTSRIPLCTLALFRKNASGRWLSGILSAKDFEVTHFQSTVRQWQVLSASIQAGAIQVPVDVARCPRLYSEMPSVPEISVPDSKSVVSEVKPIPDFNSTQPDKVEPQANTGLYSDAINEVRVPEAQGLKKTVVEDRFDIKPMPEMFNELKGCLDVASKAQSEYIKGLSTEYSLGEASLGIIENFFSKLLKYWRTKPNGYAYTGRSLLKKYLLASGEDVEQEYLGQKLIDVYLSMGSELFDFCLSGSELMLDGTALEIAESLFAFPDILYAGLVSQFLPVKQGTAQSIATQLKGYGVSFAKVLNDNPYILTICGFDFSFGTAEEVAYLRGTWNTANLQESRNIAILASNLIYSDGLDTSFVKKTILTNPLGVTLSAQDYRKLSSGDSLYAKVVEDNVKCYLGSKSAQYPRTGWVRTPEGYVQEMGIPAKQKALNSAIKVGILIESSVDGVEYVFCEHFLKQELAIVFKCYELSKKPSKYTDKERIEKLIGIFEKAKGFKLEDAQRLGVVTTVMHRVSALSGPAGSGKTTTSDCIVFVLEHYFDSNIDALEPPFAPVGHESGIEFATPTGKAAKRLQEVINRPVSTMHSKFKVGIGATTLLSDAEDEGDFTEDCANFYIFDEVAMCNLNLLYTVLCRSGNSSIAFLGDICQLPPIGKGLPFRDLLRFLPCTYLRVSKRSLEGSGLTLNSNLINKFSDRDNFKPLVSTSDFKLVECGDDDITNKIYTICGYHLGKVTAGKMEQLCGVSPIEGSVFGDLKPDDIQVVVPVSTPHYSWGATMLNKRLQTLFNPADSTKEEFKVCGYGGSEKIYRVGDRVIHTDNMYTLQWYSEIKYGREFIKDWGSGLMNGDMGIIVDVIEANRKCKFLEPSEPEPENREEPKYKIRKDKSWLGNDRYFVVVQYYDYGRKRNYYVLYQAELNKYERNRGGLVLAGEDLKSLDLAYALTTHKMQGSQGKLIIYGIGKIARQGFLSRNAVYTGQTRAERGAYIVGNVGSSINSQLNQARLLAAQEGVYTAIGIVFDTV